MCCYIETFFVQGVGGGGKGHDTHVLLHRFALGQHWKIFSVNW